MVLPAITSAITSAQIRAGRGLLKWTQGVLAARAAVSVVTLNMIESDQVAPRARTLEAIRATLEREGVRFLGDEAQGYGVLLDPRATGAGDPNPAPPAGRQACPAPAEPPGEGERRTAIRRRAGR